MTTTDLINEWKDRTGLLSPEEYIAEADKFIGRLICHVRDENVVTELMPTIPARCWDAHEEEVT